MAVTEESWFGRLSRVEKVQQTCRTTVRDTPTFVVSSVLVTGEKLDFFAGTRGGGAGGELLVDLLGCLSKFG